MKVLQDEIELLKEYITALDQCIDDYLFILDLDRNEYIISPHAQNRFNIHNNVIQDPLNGGLKAIIYNQDYDLLKVDLDQVIQGKKTYHDMQYRWITKDYSPIWVNCRGKVLKNTNGEIKYFIGCVNEIGKKQIADNMSDLLGGKSFQNLITPLETKINKGFMIRLGLDDFKNINETRGMNYGDLILKYMAECIKMHLNKDEFLYKIVGDEYIIFDQKNNIDDAIKLYAVIKEAVEQYIESINFEVYFTISAGILDFNANPTDSYAEMMQWSEFTLSCSKKEGKNTYRVFNQRDYSNFQKKNDITKELRHAVKHDFEGFHLEFQPIIDVKNQKMHSMEALLRFECRQFGKIPPNEFIPILEETDLIIPVGRWVLQEALAALSKMQELDPQLKVHVNISYVQVLKTSLLKDILNIIDQYDVKKEQLVIELTESGFVESSNTFIYFCNQLKENGISLAIDDFGTGYSNFHYLYKLKPEFIKVDRGLMHNALVNHYENMLLKHMIEMAHSVNVKLCIEGIETQNEYDANVKLHTDYIQGYYYSKPQRIDDLLLVANDLY